jgi:CheY-like chemotaxis protein
VRNRRLDPLDAIVLDIQMPGGTGIEALRKLKSRALCRAQGQPVPES